MHNDINDRVYIPKSDIDAERSVLGSMVYLEASRFAGFDELKTEFFYDEFHRDFFDVISELFQESKHIDSFSVKKLFHEKEFVSSETLIFRIDEICESAVSGMTFDSAIHAVIESYQLRQIQETIKQAEVAVNSGGAGDSKQILDVMSESILNISDQNNNTNTLSINNSLDEIHNEIMEAQKTGVFEVPSIPTMLPTLNKLLYGGFHPGELIIISARPGIGKTTIMMNFIRHIINYNLDNKTNSVAVFSLETPKKRLIENLLSTMSTVETRLIRGRTFRLRETESNEDRTKVIAEIKKLKEFPIVMSDTPNLNIRDLKVKMMNLKNKMDCKVCFIDYLQLMSVLKPASNRQEEVASISRGLKQICLELDTTIVCLSQLNRAPEVRAGSEPQLSDLRESGAIEQDADVVMMLYRDDNTDNIEGTKEVHVKLKLGKNRNGPVTFGNSNINLCFKPKLYRFEEGQPEFKNVNEDKKDNKFNAERYDPNKFYEGN